MEIRRIFESDSQGREAMRALLGSQGLGLDRHLDVSLGLFDDDGALVATGSFYKNTLRCLAVDSAWQGEGLLARVVSPLIREMNLRGEHHLFVYTRKDAAPSIAPLGFWPVAETSQIVFMENQRRGFDRYLDGLRADGPEMGAAPGAGAVVMNANPFTLGHLHLVEQALRRCGSLHLFIVREDVSAFPYAVREKLIRAGTAHLSGIRYHSTGPYLVSSATFPSYFIRESDALTLAHARIDAQVFLRIARALGITHRFLGEEPFSPATALYNRALSEALPPAGIRLRIIPRKESAPGVPISATRVRELMRQGNTQAAKALVPPSTYGFLLSAEGKEIADRLRS